jgi:hypothetical protein
MLNEPSIGCVTPLLFIGGTGLVHAADWLRTEGISHVLKLYDGDPYWPSDFTVFEIPIDDGVYITKETMKSGVDFIRRQIEADQKILVMCGLGISRSATFVLAYLLEQGYDLREAFCLLRTVRPQAWPARELWLSLISHYSTPYTIHEIMVWAIEKSNS